MTGLARVIGLLIALALLLSLILPLVGAAAQETAPGQGLPPLAEVVARVGPWTEALAKADTPAQREVLTELVECVLRASPRRSRSRSRGWRRSRCRLTVSALMPRSSSVLSSTGS